MNGEPKSKTDNSLRAPINEIEWRYCFKMRYSSYTNKRKARTIIAFDFIWNRASINIFVRSITQYNLGFIYFFIIKFM